MDIGGKIRQTEARNTGRAALDMGKVVITVGSSFFVNPDVTSVHP